MRDGEVMGARERPSLRRWSMFAFTWHFAVWVGWGLVLLALLSLTPLEVAGMGWPLVMLTVLVFIGELRPVIASDSYVTDGVPISTAFVFLS